MGGTIILKMSVGDVGCEDMR